MCRLQDSEQKIASDIYYGKFELISEKNAISWLGNEKNIKGRSFFFSLLNFKGYSILESLYMLCSKVFLCGESQAIENILKDFANFWEFYNKHHGFISKDNIFSISFSLFVLNMDLHSKLAPSLHKLEKEEYIQNTIDVIKLLIKEFKDPITNLRKNYFQFYDSNPMIPTQKLLINTFPNHIIPDQDWYKIIGLILSNFYDTLFTIPFPCGSMYNSIKNNNQPSNFFLKKLNHHHSRIRSRSSSYSLKSSSSFSSIYNTLSNSNSNSNSQLSLASNHPETPEKKNDINTTSIIAGPEYLPDQGFSRSLHDVLEISCENKEIPKFNYNNKSPMNYLNVDSEILNTDQNLGEFSFKNPYVDDSSRAEMLQQNIFKHTSRDDLPFLELSGAPWTKEGILRAYIIHPNGKKDLSQILQNWKSLSKEYFAVASRGEFALFYFNLKANSCNNVFSNLKPRRIPSESSIIKCLSKYSRAIDKESLSENRGSGFLEYSNISKSAKNYRHSSGNFNSSLWRLSTFRHKRSASYSQPNFSQNKASFINSYSGETTKTSNLTVGGGSWVKNAQKYKGFKLNHSTAELISNKEVSFGSMENMENQQCFFYLTMENDTVVILQAGTNIIAQEFIFTCNQWASRISFSTESILDNINNDNDIESGWLKDLSDAAYYDGFLSNFSKNPKSDPSTSNKDKISCVEELNLKKWIPPSNYTTNSIYCNDLIEQMKFVNKYLDVLWNAFRNLSSSYQPLKFFTNLQGNNLIKENYISKEKYLQREIKKYELYRFVLNKTMDFEKQALKN